MKTIKLSKALRGLGATSIFDMEVLLTIAAHPESGKSDLVEYVYGARDATKSGLDGSINRLLKWDLIQSTQPEHANRKAGDALKHYSLTEKGVELTRGIK
jgi:DNA-binding PadR family transcriptional regulator